MTTPRNYKTEAVIIRKTKLGEADRILTLFTPDMGKIKAVAKGVRRPRSKMSGHLELLTHSLVSLVRGRNLDTVTGSQTINSFFPLKSDLELSAAALYVLELTDQFTEERQESSEIFKLLLETLENLAKGENREMTLHYFEMHLLSLAGFKPELYACVACGKELEPEMNAFSAASGGVLCSVCQKTRYCQPVSASTLKVLRLLQSDDFNSVKGLDLGGTTSQELNRILRNYIQFLLEKEVKSAAFLNDVRSMEG